LRAALTSGSVKVILSGGGLGESLIGATYGGCGSTTRRCRVINNATSALRPVGWVTYEELVFLEQRVEGE
jgi:hypothetical protein